MKKISRILVFLLITVMAAVFIAGCNNKGTMFSDMEDASTMTQYAFEIQADFESTISGMEEVSVVFKGETDGRNTKLGVEVDYLYLSLGIDELLIINEDAIYINAPEILKLAKTYIGYDIEEMLDMELNWLEFPIADGTINLESSEEYAALSRAILEASLKNAEMTDSKGVHTAVVEGMEGFASFFENFKTAVMDNQKELENLLTQQNEEGKDIITGNVELYLDSMVNTLEKFNTDYALGLTEEDIAELKEEVENEIESLNQVVETGMEMDYTEVFDEFQASMDDIIEQCAEEEEEVHFEISNELTGKNGSRTYTTNALFTAKTTEEEEFSIAISSILTEGTGIKIEAPESVTSFEDLTYGILVFAYGNDMLDELMASSSNAPIVYVEDDYNGVVTVESEGYSAVLNYNTLQVALTDDSYPSIGELYFMPQGSADYVVGIEYVGGYTPETAMAEMLETYLSDSTYTVTNEPVDTANVGGGVYTLYECNITDGFGSVQIYFFSLAFEESRTLMIGYAYGDELAAEGIDPQTFGRAVFMDAIDTTPLEVYTDMYQGTVTLTYDDISATIHYNEDLVYVDAPYSDPESGDVCFSAVADPYCYVFLYLYDEYSDMDFYDNEVEYNSQMYNNSKATEITTEVIDGVTFDRYTATYTTKDEVNPHTFNREYLRVTLPDGRVLYTDSSDFDENSVLSFDEMVKAIFTSVE